MWKEIRICKLKCDKFCYCWDRKGCKKTLCRLPVSNTVNRNTVKSKNNSSIPDSSWFILSMQGRIDLKCLFFLKKPHITSNMGNNGSPPAEFSQKLTDQEIYQCIKNKKKQESVQYSQSDDVLFWECLCGWWWRAGSSFSLLVEMADERPRARQGCQFSLSKSCVALEYLEGERRDKDKS